MHMHTSLPFFLTTGLKTFCWLRIIFIPYLYQQPLRLRDRWYDDDNGDNDLYHWQKDQIGKVDVYEAC